MIDFQELLARRRSVRQYEDRPVAPDIIHELLRECTLAPSAGNTQPWRFVVVQNREWLRRLSDHSKACLLARIEAHPNHFALRYEAYLRDPDFNVFYDAPCLILIACPKALKTGPLDVALAAAYFMLGAAARGLGSCWIGLGACIEAPDIRAELGLTPGDQVVAPLILGYPREVPATPERNAPQILKFIN
ncbi:MAG: nitroreductase family protein [Acidobacteria bacterium]|nr:nitroreductase family protein [Acidobacteriota bacterium]